LVWALGIGLLMAVLSLRGALSGLEWRAYDRQLSVRAPGVPRPDIIIVIIDDSCLDRFGPWPWPVSRHIELLHKLAAAQPQAIVFDILFFGQTSAQAEQFAAAVRDAGNVYLAVCFLEGERPLRLGRYGVRLADLRAPPARVRAAAAGVGAVNVFPERDGVVRSAPLVIDHAGRPFPALALQVVSRGVRHREPAITASGGHLRARLAGDPIPVNEAGEMLISYAGGYRAFPWVSYDAVLAGHADPERFHNKIVLVGFTATGLSDTRPTPLAPACPGVEINAHVIHTLLEGDYVAPLGAEGNALVVLLLAAALGLILPRLRPFAALLGGPVAALVVVAAAIYLFQSHALWMNVVAPALTAITVGVVLAARGYRASDRDRVRLEFGLGALSLATRMIGASTSRQTVLDAIREEITQVLAARQTDVYLVDDDAAELVLAGGGCEARAPLTEGALGRVAREGVPLLLPEANADAEVAAEVRRAVDFQPGPVAFIPLRRHNQVVGVAQVVRAPGCEPFGESDLELLNALSQEAAVALENVELYEKLEGKVELANRELVRAYSQLALEKDRVEALLENMTDAVIMTDTDCRVLYVNPAAERMFRLSAKQVEGAPVARDFAAAGPLPAMIAEACRLPGELVSRQVVIEQPKRMVLSANAAVVADDQGQAVGVVTVLSDVTLLQELSDMKTEFVSLVSHELRTPLTSIQGFAQTLRHDVDGNFDAAARAEFLGIIETECQRLLAMINELLDASRIEAGRALSMNWAPVSIPALVEQLVKLHVASAEGHRFEIDMSADFPEIEGDRDRIEQVLTNIISNAIKYSPDGGAVRITGRRDGDQVLVSVADDGLGMTEAQLGQLFQRYHRIESDPSKRIRGTGLGLYLTKGLVEAHGGRIWAESEGPGKGSKFSFVLPIKRVEGNPE
jgi:PAS domain S-box-containing protein